MKPTLTIRLDKDTKIQLKVYLAQKDKTLQEFLEDFIQEKLEEGKGV